MLASKHPGLRRILSGVPEGRPNIGLSPSSSPVSTLSRKSSTLGSSRFSKSSSSTLTINSPVPFAPSPAPAPSPPAGLEWKKIYNQTSDQCEWPLPPPSTATKPCAFPFEATENIQTVILPAGTELFHATQIFPKQTEWFTETSFNTLPGKVMWFASSPQHAKHMNYTHILRFKTAKDIKLVFIRNLLKDMGSNTGKDLVKNPEFQTLLRADPELVGYVGCNECEIGIFKEKLSEAIVLPPDVLETRSYKYISGGSRKHRRTLRRKSRRLGKPKRKLQ